MKTFVWHAWVGVWGFRDAEFQLALLVHHSAVWLGLAHAALQFTFISRPLVYDEYAAKEGNCKICNAKGKCRHCLCQLTAPAVWVVVTVVTVVGVRLE